MTRIIGSLKSYLVDLWKRCFAKEYLVKAEGESTAMHDFRKCADCDARTKSLHTEGRSYCKECGAFLCVDGKYLDTKKRTFVLKRPLYGKLNLSIKAICFLNFIAVVSVFRIRQVFIGYEADLIGYPLYSVFLIALIISSGYYMVMCIGTRTAWLSALFSLYIAAYLTGSCMLVLFMAVRPIKNGYHIAPFWVAMPMQQEVHEKQLRDLNAMPTSVDRFSYAANNVANPMIDLQKEFMGAVAADFGGMMKAHPGAYLRLKVGSSEEAEFYSLYGTYLMFLDSEARKAQCEKDPWHLATGLTAARFPETWKACVQ